MSGPPIELKDYQRQTLDSLAAWLVETTQAGDPDVAFYRLTRRAYQPVAGLPGVPYACLRVPTGGGKTLIAAHAIGRATDAFIRADAVWSYAAEWVTVGIEGGVSRRVTSLPEPLEESDTP